MQLLVQNRGNDLVTARKVAKMRELFIDELIEVRGGATSALDTTHACCEEGPLGCCDRYDWIFEAVEDLLP